MKINVFGALNFSALVIPLFSIFVFSSPAFSQDLEELQRGLRSATAAIVTLQSDDNISSGSYTLKNSDAKDASLDLLKLAVELPVPRSDSGVMPFVEFSAAQVDLKQPAEDSLTDLKIESVGAGLSAGVRLKFFEESLHIVPRVKFEYSEIDFKVRGDLDGVTEANELLPDYTTRTYIPSLEMLYTHDLSKSGRSLRLGSTIEYIYLDAESDSALVNDFWEETWVWRNAYSVQQPLTLLDRAFILEPTLARVEVHGSARDGLDFNNFYEIGATIATHTILTEFFATVGFRTKYVYEKEIQGWLFGVFGNF
jgi:hypothetical protein